MATNNRTSTRPAQPANSRSGSRPTQSASGRANPQPIRQPGLQLPEWLTKTLSKIPNCSGEDFGVPLGKPFMDIPIILHFNFFLVFILVLILSIVGYKTSKYSWLIFLAYGPLLLLTVLIQEVGRAWFAIHKKDATVKKIVLWPLGGYVFTATDIDDKMDDIKVAVFGILLHIPQILVWFIILACTGLSEYGDPADDLEGLKEGGAKRFMAELSGELITINMAILIINSIVPAYPLACSRFATAIMINRGMDTKNVAYYTSITSMVLFVANMIVASKYKTSANGKYLMTVGFFLFTAGCTLCMQAKSGTHMQHPLFNRDLYRESGVSSRPEQPRPASRKKQPAKKDTAETDVEEGNRSNRN